MADSKFNLCFFRQFAMALLSWAVPLSLQPSV